MLCTWDELPEYMKIKEVRIYYDSLQSKKGQLKIKRIFDIIVSSILIVLFSPVFLLLAVAIKIDSPGTVFYRQERVTQYGRRFRIHKFRSMVSNADKTGSLVTVSNDARITKVGKLIRDCRLDEIAQLLDVLEGTMTFVGTRPEVPKYVEKYSKEMYATLLLPAGVTSLASIEYKDEAVLLDMAKDVDKVYVETILPDKMRYNLRGIIDFSIMGDIVLMIKTVLAVI